MTHCGTVSFSSIDSVSPPESLHSSLQQKQHITHSTVIVQLQRVLMRPDLKRVLPPASPNITGVWGGTWKYPFPFWTLFSCSPFTVDTTQSCKSSEPTLASRQLSSSTTRQCWREYSVKFQSPHRGSPRSPPHPLGWCAFWARTPAEPGATTHPGSLQMRTNSLRHRCCTNYHKVFNHNIMSTAHLVTMFCWETQHPDINMIYFTCCWEMIKKTQKVMFNQPTNSDNR